MKKILCFFVSILMLCQISVFADVLTAELEYDSIRNGFYISGTSADTKTYDEITIEGFYNNTPFNVIVTETKKENEKIIFKTDIIMLDSTLNSGEIYFKIYSAHQSPVVTSKFTYTGISALYSVLKELDEKLKNNDIDGFLSVVSLNKDALLLDYDSVSGLSSFSLNTVKSYLKNIKMNLPSSCDTDEQKREAFSQLSYLREEFKSALIIGEMLECSTVSELSDWYGENKDILLLKQFDEKRYKYFENNMSNQCILSFMKEGSVVFASFDKFKEKIIEAGALCTIESGGASNVKSVFDDFDSRITKLYNLTENQQPSIFLKIAGTENATFEILSDLYNRLAYEYLYPQQPGQNIPTGSFGGGFSSSSGGAQIIVEPVTNQGNTAVFNDMQNAKWAEEAVYSLYKKGIVSGRTANTFAPNDNITRAEFAKLLVAVKGAENNNSSVIFKDVKPNDWFFEYVNSAYNFNITKGYEDGTFKPYNNITREDMAVMIYRYLGANSDSINLSAFSDNEHISDYAKEAVSYLYENKIISGMGNGTFSPKLNATRAQAAQMIYNFTK